MRIRIYPYNSTSQSAKALSKVLGIPRIKRNNSKFKGKPNDLIINWGNSILPDALKNCKILNKPYAVGLASNKFLTFTKLMYNGVPIPRVTTDLEVAKDWGSTVIARRLLTSHSGNGISVLSEPEHFDEDLSDVKLFTEYVKPLKEFRVHVIGGVVIDIAQKKKRKGYEQGNFEKHIRSYNNGWVFCREDISYPDSLIKIAKRAIKYLRLDFGAIDIILDENEEPVVLEVNTAPGLIGTTLVQYADYLNFIINDHHYFNGQVFGEHQ